MTSRSNRTKSRQNTTNLGFAILLLVVLGCSCPKLNDIVNKGTPTPTPAPTQKPGFAEPTPETSSKGDYDVSMAKYSQILIGMARSDVERILGGKGTEISNNVGGGVRFTVNKWEGEKFKSIILSFKNDKVMSKSQVGLK